MPERKTIERARQDKREGKAPSTQAGEFVKETMEHIRQGKHGARSTKQAIAIGLSKARRAGVKLPPPKKGKTSEKTRKSAERAFRKGQSGHESKTNPRRSAAITRALKREGHQAASSQALSRQAKQQAGRRRIWVVGSTQGRRLDLSEEGTGRVVKALSGNPSAMPFAVTRMSGVTP